MSVPVHSSHSIAFHRSGDPLREYTRSLFDSLPRADQRRWAKIYLQGLLEIPGKKSIRRMVERLLGCDSAGATQSLQQFVNQSPWDWSLVRGRLAEITHEAMRVKFTAVRQVVIPKNGTHSVGVSRQFIPSEGRTVNCQLGVGLLQVGEWASVPVDWRIHLGDEWIVDRFRRERARIPLSVQGKNPADLILDMVDSAVRRRVHIGPVVTDVEQISEVKMLLQGMMERGVDYVLEVRPDLEVFPGAHLTAVSGRGRDGKSLISAQEHMLRGRLSATRKCGVQREPQILSSLVQLPFAAASPVPALVPHRLLVERSSKNRQAKRYWITNMVHRDVKQVIGMLDAYRRSANGIDSLERYGVQDFEGRSFFGWHHHMTLVSAAYAFEELDIGAGTSQIDLSSA